METIVLKVSFCEEDIVEDIEVLIHIKLFQPSYYVHIRIQTFYPLFSSL